VSIQATEIINCTKNQEKGTISIPTINFGKACLRAKVSPPAQTIFAKAITMSKKANTK